MTDLFRAQGLFPEESVHVAGSGGHKALGSPDEPGVRIAVGRLVSLCTAAAALVVASPLFFVLMAVNRAMTGQLFFKQIRVGQDLQPFELLKFQTMIDGAAGSTVTGAYDSRITPYGRILRLVKLDELPQLLNILRGEMELVGPRPLTPNEVDALPRQLAIAVYRVRPGLTGISALAFADEQRYLARGADHEQTYFTRILPRKVALELGYARRRTWVTDMMIVLLTPFAPFSSKVRHYALNILLPEWEKLMNDCPEPLVPETRSTP